MYTPLVSFAQLLGYLLPDSFDVVDLGATSIIYLLNYLTKTLAFLVITA